MPSALHPSGNNLTADAFHSRGRVTCSHPDVLANLKEAPVIVMSHAFRRSFAFRIGVIEEATPQHVGGMMARSGLQVLVVDEHSQPVPDALDVSKFEDFALDF